MTLTRIEYKDLGMEARFVPEIDSVVPEIESVLKDRFISPTDFVLGIRFHRLLLALLAIALLVGSVSESALAQRPLRRQRGHSVTTPNFVIHAADPALASAIADKAEVFRKELAIEWLGRELPNWPQRCPINVQVAMQAGGETSFAFIMDHTGRGVPTDWDMKIFGPPDRLLDAVLPHEITHTIFATHFGRPLPRWADEGACTTVEHESERRKNHQMLIDFLTSRPSRGIPFNRMFIMRDYPRDILPLYAQGYSLARYLIMLKGRRHFIDYIGAGISREESGPRIEAWDQTTSEYYRFADLSDLQLKWIGWVKDGSRENETAPPATTVTLASNISGGTQSSNNGRANNIKESGIDAKDIKTNDIDRRNAAFAIGPPQTFAAIKGMAGQNVCPPGGCPATGAAFRTPDPIASYNAEPNRSTTEAGTSGISNGGWYAAQRTNAGQDNSRIAARHGGFSSAPQDRSAQIETTGLPSGRGFNLPDHYDDRQLGVPNENDTIWR